MLTSDSYRPLREGPTSALIHTQTGLLPTKQMQPLRGARFSHNQTRKDQIMAKIGNMRSKQTANGEILEGSISTLENDFSFHAVKLPGVINPSAPTHKLCAWNKNGVEVQIGSAWTKSIKNPERQGEVFMTLTFDDPSFEKPLNVAAFKNAQTGDWDIMFRRRQSRAA